MARIRLHEISFTYEGASKPALLPISLDINDGEAFSLLGASGAGKTTMLNLLSGILRPTKGRVFFDDVVVIARIRGRVIIGSLGGRGPRLPLLSSFFPRIFRGVGS